MCKLPRYIKISKSLDSQQYDWLKSLWEISKMTRSSVFFFYCEKSPKGDTVLDNAQYQDQSGVKKLKSNSTFLGSFDTNCAICKNVHIFK
jgi:hypothetical protein